MKTLAYSSSRSILHTSSEQTLGSLVLPTTSCDVGCYFQNSKYCHFKQIVTDDIITNLMMYID